jgi:hypothetical protein
MKTVFDVYCIGKRLISFKTRREAESYVTVAKAVFSFDNSEIKIRQRAIS